MKDIMKVSKSNLRRLLLPAFFILPAYLSAQPLNDSLYTFTDPTLAFRIRLPVPANKVYKEPSHFDSAGEIYQSLYHCVDTRENTYYTFGVQSVAPGYVIKDEKTFVAYLRKNLGKGLVRIIRDTAYLMDIKGYMVFDLIGSRKNSDRWAAYRFVGRGNRWYMISVDCPPRSSAGYSKKLLDIYNSLAALPLISRPWRSSGLSDPTAITWTPAPLAPKTSREPGVYSFYVSFDSIRCNTYNINSYPLNPYYWSLSDTAFWSDRIAAHMGKEDSLFYKKPVTNGDAKGWEFLTLGRYSRICQRRRLLLYGDSIYILHVNAMPEDVVSQNTDHFFEEFRFTNPVAKTHVFESKAKLLLDALFGADKQAAAAALAYLPRAPFVKEDLPLLYACCLKKPASRIDTFKLNARIDNAIVNLVDKGTFRWAAEQYKNGPGFSNYVKSHLLVLMCMFAGEEHCAEAANLILRAPRETLDPTLFISLRMNEALATRVMPELLYMLADSVSGPFVIDAVNVLVNDRRLAVKKLAPYESVIVQFAHHRTAVLSTDEGEVRDYDGPTVNLLGLLNSSASNAALREYFETDFQDLRVKAFAGLFRNAQHTEEDIQSLAADKSTRLDLYRILLQAGKQQLFPHAYLTQQLFAESEIYEKAMETELEPPAAIELVTMKYIYVQKDKKRFYFYKMKSANGSSFPACAGPYDINTSQVDLLYPPAVIDYKHLYDATHAEDEMTTLLARFN